MTSLPDVENIFQLKSYDELSKIINDWLAGDDETEDTGTERNTNSQTTTEKSDGEYSSLDDAFADLMD